MAMTINFERHGETYVLTNDRKIYKGVINTIYGVSNTIQAVTSQKNCKLVKWNDWVFMRFVSILIRYNIEYNKM